MSKCPTKRSNSRLITVLIPVNLITQLDAAAGKDDSDRSKYIRAAVREKMARSGESSK
jgi:metal-responsive CopG/Arc/MetJ family transcriptional regulator